MSKWKTNLLFEKQQGLSPITGKPLTGRLEKHHWDPMFDGGSPGLDNQVLLPIHEHLLDHLILSRDMTRSAEARRIDLDVVLARVGELTEAELREFHELVETRVGIRIRFVR